MCDFKGHQNNLRTPKIIAHPPVLKFLDPPLKMPPYNQSFHEIIISLCYDSILLYATALAVFYSVN